MENMGDTAVHASDSASLPVIEFEGHIVFPAFRLQIGKFKGGAHEAIAVILLAGAGGLSMTLSPDEAETVILGLQRACEELRAEAAAQAEELIKRSKK